MAVRNFFRQLYFDKNLFFLLALASICFVLGQFIAVLFSIAKIFLVFLLVLVLIDIYLLFFVKKARVIARRDLPEKLSNGDGNTVNIYLKSHFRVELKITILDEVPVQFQIRDMKIYSLMKPLQEKQFSYTLVPKKRGEYHFGKLNVFIKTRQPGFVKRRFAFDFSKMVPVYPSFIQMKKMEIFAISNKIGRASCRERVCHRV